MKKVYFLAWVMTGLLFMVQAPYAMSSNEPQVKAPNQTQVQTAQSYGLPDFTQLAADNSPVVVNISTTKKIKQQRPPQFQGMPEDLLRYFFGIPNGRQGMPGDRQEELQQPMPQQEVHSLGSGFIISKDGYILTNNHVVDGADDIVVRMRNRKELKAKVVGTDSRSDVALLKIEADNLPVAKIGSSSDLKVGQWVLAIGEPFGLDYTVTHGIVSAIGRSLPDDTYVPFIQTDVSINPGNSGGPLFNLNGEVVGINSQIYSKNGGSMGLSFSIPIDIAMNVAAQLKDSGKVARGYLGVLVQEVTSDLSKSFGMEAPMGALVGETYPDTPAERAGIRAGDIILEFNGQQVKKSADLPPLVGVAKINTPIKVLLLRQGKKVTVNVKLTELDKADQIASADGGASKNASLGAVVEALSKDELDALNLPFGVKVLSVGEGAASKAGIRPGDIIVTIDFQPVKNVESLRQILKQAPAGRSLPVRVVRNKRSLFLPLVVEK
ncbi:DegQ family serine endoprotease [Thiomicrorhabdus sp. ZW0627]|uniref:DegQ family serine endoprotease n=1 Tax=Thiomicrorhabdus sp. ZW0627 TaxID=3039774 RepID=UPI0024371DAA|nr:DegQ family serine endoprotease [Thiomicrorhabdus sp. ZW0627]MDG6773189.1 DegQ family serine endoprotease [Thiomicrorhabdus sp. ZW0627]